MARASYSPHAVSPQWCGRDICARPGTHDHSRCSSLARRDGPTVRT